MLDQIDTTRVRVAIGASIALILVSLLVMVSGGRTQEVALRQTDDHDRFSDTALPPTTDPSTTFTEPLPTTLPPTTEAPATTPPATRPAVPRTTAPPDDCTVEPSGPVDVPEGIRPYAGLGTWVDVYDWSMSHTGGSPHVGVTDIDRMATLGVQTLYIQTNRFTSPDDVMILEPELLMSLIDRAHQNGLAVVTWYLPTHEKPQVDLERLVAAANLPVEGIAVDLESSAVRDLATRSAEAVALSKALRERLPGRVIGAIPIPPVINTFPSNYWPNFPWADLAPYYDVWMPMAYWSQRARQPQYLDAHLYMAENIDLLRQWIGQPDAVVSPVGGIGDRTSCRDVARMIHALQQRGAIGGSIYDYRTTNEESWTALRALRR